MFKNSGVAIITPFKNNNIDYDSLGMIVKNQLESGTSAIIANGTTAEASTLTDEEKFQVLEFIINEVSGKIPVIAGVSSNDTAKVIKEIQLINKLAVSGLMICPPYYNKTSELGLIKHFEFIMEHTDLPIILYNIPSRCGIGFSLETLVTLSYNKQVVGVKEASGDISFTAKVIRNINKSVKVYSGNDDQILPILSIGGAGVISATANIIPKEVSNLCISFESGDVQKALEIHTKLLNFTNSVFNEVNPIGVKAIMSSLNLCENELRLPLVCASAENHHQLVKLFKEIST